MNFCPNFSKWDPQRAQYILSFSFSYHAMPKWVSTIFKWSFRGLQFRSAWLRRYSKVVMLLFFDLDPQFLKIMIFKVTWDIFYGNKSLISAFVCAKVEICTESWKKRILTNFGAIGHVYDVFCMVKSYSWWFISQSDTNEKCKTPF